ncbi:MAG TPA: DUF1320 domain-containing protein [Fibrobacteria bacterium]|nr:DUF1320 domain-containing protein [Fibrobacteria bacterium]
MYCTVDDLKLSHPDLRLIETTDDAHPNATGFIQVSIAQEQIDLACGVIDGYLASRYSLPLSTTPIIVKKIAVDLSLHGLYERIGAAGKDSDMDLRRKSAMDLLTAIAKGSISLGLASSQSQVVEASPESFHVSTGGDAEFGMESTASLGGMFL